MASLLPMSLSDNVIPYFQPIIAVDTCTIMGYELLGRKNTPQGIQSLGPFFHDPQIQADVKLSVDRFLRKRALELWKQTHTGKALFLNIQPQWIYTFRNKRSMLPTIEMLRELGVSGRQIVIEIAESQFWGDMNVLVDLISKYRRVGCKIAIDDVGTGFSNFDRISEIHPDYLKIDAKLVQKGTENQLASCFLRSIGNWAERMGIELIFEGVETPEQFTLGLYAGARYYQGFLFAVPGPHLMEDDHKINSVQLKMEQYVDETAELIHEKMQLSYRMNRFVESINWHLGGLNADDYLSALVNRVPGECFRMYVCNPNGVQITPNHKRNPDQKWIIQPEFIGRYWGWRPYFLPILAGSMHTRRGVLSDPYFDIETQEKLCTFCYPVSQDRFLFLDCNIRNQA